MSMYFLKVHNINGKKIVAICDEEILGQVYKEGNVILDVSFNFYGGKKVDVEEAVRAIDESDIAVISGKRIVNELEKRGLASKEFAISVQGQLHIQIVKEVIEI
ncbi:MAG: DUF424 family protein [Ignisphaera sp.]|jgi:hypothetical protein|nr:DUF424 family protein [Ignisphaera sp.]